MVDKSSPRYPAYMEECAALGDWVTEALSAVDARQKQAGDSLGLDDPDTLEVYRELSFRLKEIRKKYGFE